MSFSKKFHISTYLKYSLFISVMFLTVSTYATPIDNKNYNFRLHPNNIISDKTIYSYKVLIVDSNHQNKVIEFVFVQNEVARILYNMESFGSGILWKLVLKKIETEFDEISTTIYNINPDSINYYQSIGFMKINKFYLNEWLKQYDDLNKRLLEVIRPKIPATIEINDHSAQDSDGEINVYNEFEIKDIYYTKDEIKQKMERIFNFKNNLNDLGTANKITYFVNFKINYKASIRAIDFSSKYIVSTNWQNCYRGNPPSPPRYPKIDFKKKYENYFFDKIDLVEDWKSFSNDLAALEHHDWGYSESFKKPIFGFSAMAAFGRAIINSQKTDREKFDTSTLFNSNFEFEFFYTPSLSFSLGTGLFAFDIFTFDEYNEYKDDDGGGGFFLNIDSKIYYPINPRFRIFSGVGWQFTKITKSSFLEDINNAEYIHYQRDSRWANGLTLKTGFLYTPDFLRGLALNINYKYFREISKPEGIDPFTSSTFLIGLMFITGMH